ncbi:HBS1-like protein, partial [Tachysurus ichikawai]
DTASERASEADTASERASEADTASERASEADTASERASEADTASERASEADTASERASEADTASERARTPLGFLIFHTNYSFKAPQRSVEKPFRLCVSDVFKDQGSGFCVTGKIQAGFIQTGERVLVMPPNETCTVKGIALHDEPLDWAAAGDHVSLTVTGMDIIKINVGCVFCDPKEPIRSCTRFRARILLFNIEVPITQGFPVLLHYQTVIEPATIRKLVSVLHKTSGEVLKKKPK